MSLSLYYKTINRPQCPLVEINEGEKIIEWQMWREKTIVKWFTLLLRRMEAVIIHKVMPIWNFSGLPPTLRYALHVFVTKRLTSSLSLHDVIYEASVSQVNTWSEVNFKYWKTFSGDFIYATVSIFTMYNNFSVYFLSQNIIYLFNLATEL